MGIEPKKMGLIDYNKAVQMCEEASKKYNLIIDPRAKVQDLSVGIKQKIDGKIQRGKICKNGFRKEKDVE